MSSFEGKPSEGSQGIGWRLIILSFNNQIKQEAVL
jgi:hypothetical protein